MAGYDAVFAEIFLQEPTEKHDVFDTVFLIGKAARLRTGHC